MPLKQILALQIPLNNDHLSTTTSGHLNLVQNGIKSCLQRRLYLKNGFFHKMKHFLFIFNFTTFIRMGFSTALKLAFLKLYRTICFNHFLNFINILTSWPPPQTTTTYKQPPLSLGPNGRCTQVWLYIFLHIFFIICTFLRVLHRITGLCFAFLGLFKQPIKW